ncbi:MAG: chromate transporter [Oleiphilaceae bacterium]
MPYIKIVQLNPFRQSDSDTMITQNTPITLLNLFALFFRLGCTSFGGPIAHIGFFHHEFVDKRKWYSEEEYLQMVALCQFLPGPASSQVGMAIGLNARGYMGSLISFIGFTLPSALLMMSFAFLIESNRELIESSVLYVLKIVAVAVVAQAIWTMSKAQCLDAVRVSITLTSVFLAITINNPFSQILIIMCAGFAGYLFCKPELNQINGKNYHTPKSKRLSILLITTFFIILFAAPFLSNFSNNDLVSIFDSFYRSGALVFGGGHVVLPLLENELVSTGLIDNEQFLYGYSVAQAIPGPLFTFSSYLGVLSVDNSSPIIGSLVATFAIFLPGYLLLVSLLPYWQTLCKNETLSKAIRGINASVVGLLIASFIYPIWIETIHSLLDLIFAVLLFIALIFWKLSPLKLISISVAAALIFDLLFIY